MQIKLPRNISAAKMLKSSEGGMPVIRPHVFHLLKTRLNAPENKQDLTKHSVQVSQETVMRNKKCLLMYVHKPFMGLKAFAAT